jgi:hypothetical protein
LARPVERDVMPRLSPIKAEAWMTTVMADDQYADRLFVNEAKQDRVWKTVHETPANTVQGKRTTIKIKELQLKCHIMSIL